jgi:hypothetical protein
MSPNLTGAWKANLQKSKTIGPGPKEMRMKIAHAEPILDVEMFITTQDGAQHRVPFRTSTTGEEAIHSVLGQTWRSRLRWIGQELLIESWVKHANREFHFRDFWSLSADGQALTMEHRDDDLAGQITILERQPEQGQ